MEISSKILSDITVHMKYAKYIPAFSRREIWSEIIDRNKGMHLKKFPHLADEIETAYKFVYDRQVLPSMRSLQFAGKPIELNPARIYNCSFLPMNSPDCFAEVMFLLLSGCGVGYSVQRHHIEELPDIQRPRKTRRYLVGDSIEGWSDAVKVLVNSYFEGKALPIFDFSDIRPKGASLITSGGKSPGPEPLKECLFNIQKILDRKEIGEKLTSLEVHDINCYIADAVLSGGIRRSAMISLFDLDDEDMLTCKFGSWYEIEPQRARSNNSAVILRHKIDKDTFIALWQKIEASNSGEPGFFFSNERDYGLNPCKSLDSLILTDTGYITFRQALERTELTVVRPDGKFVSASTPFKTGTNRVVSKIMLSNGSHLLATENHKHQLVSGEWKRVDELEIGDRLAFAAHKIHDIEVTDVSEYESGILHGWLVTDGWNYLRNDGNSNRAGIVLGQNEFDLEPLFERLTNHVATPHNQHPDTAKTIYVRQDLIDTDFSKESFDWVRLKSASYKLGFIRAAFTADGSARKSNNCELYATNRPFLETVQTILLEFGIRSTITIHNYSKQYVARDGTPRNNSDCWKLNVFAGQFKRIGFLSDAKSKLLEMQHDSGLYRRINYETVVDIVDEWSVEDVYDITVHDDSHAFFDTGVVTHNCAEISLKPFQFCNLTTINASDIHDQETLNDRAKAAAFIGTLQASYTDFHYLRDVWKRTTEKEALIGVSMTGIASGGVLKLDLEQSANIVKTENARVAALLDINKAARTTTVKPEGTTSLVLGSSSGIHAWHNRYYIRRLRVGKNEPIYTYLKIHHPELLEDDFFKPNIQSIINIPQKSPRGSITRHESALELLERVSHVWKTWVKPGHRKGGNVNNVSTTVTIKNGEWADVGQWMWEHRHEFTALSVLPFSDHTYVQAPFEDITKEQYEGMLFSLTDVDLSQVIELSDGTSLAENLACSGGACEVI